MDLQEISNEILAIRLPCNDPSFWVFLKQNSKYNCTLSFLTFRHQNDNPGNLRINNERPFVISVYQTTPLLLLLHKSQFVLLFTLLSSYFLIWNKKKKITWIKLAVRSTPPSAFMSLNHTLWHALLFKAIAILYEK